jgi:hypothetical protein
MKKKIYLTMAGLGVVLPFYYFVPWTNANGFNLPRMLDLIFVNPIASGIAADAITVALAVIAFIILERREIKVPYFWIPIAGIFLVGVAFALPCYLYLRERGLEQKENNKS